MSIEKIFDYLISNNITLCSIESFTGGLFSSYITSIPNASKFFLGAIVTYSTKEKISLLGINEELVNRYGVVSKEIALEMSKLGRKKMNSDISISFTGNAGPSAMENKKVGEIYIGLSFKDNDYVFPYLLNGTRNEIRNKAIELALVHLSDLLNIE